MTLPASLKPETRTVNYFDPVAGCRVQKDVTVPPPAKVKDLNGMTVEEIPSMDALKSLWCNNITADLRVPLSSHSRNVLREALSKAFTDQADKDAVAELCSSWQPTDDRVVKLLGRLLTNAGGQDVNKSALVDRMVHEKALWQDERARLHRERDALTQDVNKLLSENRQLAQQSSSQDLAYLGLRINGLENSLTQTIKQKLAVEQERDNLRRDAQRNVEIALTEYETTVMGKMADVAKDHKMVVDENLALKSEIRHLNQQVNTTQKESAVVNNPQKVAETTPVEALKSGDEVYCKVSGEGPFVLVTKIDEAQIEYANPVSGRKNSFNVGKLPIFDAWLVRCKDTTFRTMPEATLTNAAPRSRLSFDGLKRVVTSDVTSKLAQAAIWATLVALLVQRTG
jgi:hypothetical protein